MLFVAVNIERGAVMKAWLVPSEEYTAAVGQLNSRGRYKFVASMKEGPKDRWASRRLEAHELPPALLARLAVLEASGQ